MGDQVTFSITQSVMKVFVALLSFGIVALALAAPPPTQTPEEYERWVVNATEDLKKYVAVTEHELTELYKSTAANKNALIVAKIDEVVPNLYKRLVVASAELSLAPNQHLAELALNLAAGLQFEIETLERIRKQFDK